MIFGELLLGTSSLGYIAGTGDGIVTVRGQPAARDLVLLDAKSLAVLYRTASLKNGHYIFFGLDVNKEYLVMVRDFKREMEPFVWDYVKPANDLTGTEQQALWQTWQT